MAYPSAFRALAELIVDIAGLSYMANALSSDVMQQMHLTFYHAGDKKAITPAVRSTAN